MYAEVSDRYWGLLTWRLSCAAFGALLRFLAALSECQPPMADEAGGLRDPEGVLCGCVFVSDMCARVFMPISHLSTRKAVRATQFELWSVTIGAWPCDRSLDTGPVVQGDTP